jgi:hypothetical protein
VSHNGPFGQDQKWLRHILDSKTNGEYYFKHVQFHFLTEQLTIYGKKQSRDIICCLHKKIRTLKQSLKPLLMAAILGKLLTKNRQFQMLITFEPFIRFLQMKAQKSSYIELYLMVKKQQASPVIDF